MRAVSFSASMRLSPRPSGPVAAKRAAITTAAHWDLKRIGAGGPARLQRRSRANIPTAAQRPPRWTGAVTAIRPARDLGT